MGTFNVNLTAVNPTERRRSTPPEEVMVDTRSLLGAITIEGFGVMVDPVNQCFVDIPSYVPATLPAEEWE